MTITTIAGFLLSLLILDGLNLGVAQDPGPTIPPPTGRQSRNPIEEFVSRKGVVIVKRMYAIKTFSWGAQDESVSLAVSAMHAYEADRAAEGVYAVRFEGRPRAGIPFSALLDLTSARSLVSALDEMIAKGRESAGQSPEFLEVRFALADTLECGYLQQGAVQRPFVILGSDVVRSIRSARMEDLADLKVAVAQEIDTLKKLEGR